MEASPTCGIVHGDSLAIQVEAAHEGVVGGIAGGVFQRPAATAEGGRLGAGTGGHGEIGLGSRFGEDAHGVVGRPGKLGALVRYLEVSTGRGLGLEVACRDGDVSQCRAGRLLQFFAAGSDGQQECSDSCQAQL